MIAADVTGLADLPAAVHTPVSAKGLEFDAVVIVDPERIRAHNPADLYVSLTRATQRLGLLHVGFPERPVRALDADAAASR